MRGGVSLYPSTAGDKNRKMLSASLKVSLKVSSDMVK